MAFVDPEQAEVAIEALRVTYAARATEAGPNGATGRSFPVIEALHRWMMAEIALGTDPQDINAAASAAAATILSTAADTNSKPGHAICLLSAMTKHAFVIGCASIERQDWDGAVVHPGRPN